MTYELSNGILWNIIQNRPFERKRTEMKLGDWGEEKAVEYLSEKGYQIIQRNFRCKAGEIDIVTIHKNTLVFIEVKTRNNMHYGLPCEAITPTKMRHLKKAIAYYTAIYKMEDWDLQLDVLELLMVEGHCYVHHLEDVYFS